MNRSSSQSVLPDQDAVVIAFDRNAVPALNRRGRRIGNHGNRPARLIKEAALLDLREVFDRTGEVSRAVKLRVANNYGVDVHTVNRWWRTLRDTIAADRDLNLRDGNPTTESPHDNGDGNGGRDGGHGGDGTGGDGGGTGGRLPDRHEVELMLRQNRYLYRAANPDELQFTPAEIMYIGMHARAIDAFDKFWADPEHRLHTYSRSSLYRALNNIAPSVRVAMNTKKEKEQRAVESTYPLTDRDQVNKSWSTDEYDLKIEASYNGAVVHPKFILVRDRTTDQPLSYLVLPGAVTQRDTGIALASAALGYTVAHPFDPDRQMHVGGLAKFLVCDQGSALFGKGAAAAGSRLGMSERAAATYQPQSNGDHEVLHQFIPAFFGAGMGSRRGWTPMAGEMLDHGVPPWEWVLERAEKLFVALMHREFNNTADPRHGLTRIKAYTQAVENGDVHHGQQFTDEDLAALAVVKACHKYDPTRGVRYKPEGADRSRYYNSPALARYAKPSQDIILARLDSDDFMYAFTANGKFISWVGARDDAHPYDVTQQYDEIALRNQFANKMGHRAARLAIEDADKAMRETADGLAKASDHLEADHADEDAHGGEDQVAPTDQALPTGPARTAEPDTGTTTAPPDRAEVVDRVASRFPGPAQTPHDDHTL